MNKSLKKYKSFHGPINFKIFISLDLQQKSFLYIYIYIYIYIYTHTHTHTPSCIFGKKSDVDYQFIILSLS